ncbi:pentraxin fusion protein-like [Hypanus sabinus]|uniref:pentraxin fusion protein-like n=1 Tax=Hypanus sabinus TaxID=79690 RepID=UPI0028C3D7B4|nr:pentraxin fusion protein-like [Hypanus sabinus]
MTYRWKFLLLGTNIAQDGRATQSSNERSAHRAIDGETGNKDSCAMTKVERDPWWSLDLQQKHQVWSVRITNTEGDPKEGIEGAEIHISDSFLNFGNENLRCATIQSIRLGGVETFDCGGKQGRYINIVRPGDKQHLTLCEVEVFAQPLFIIQPC